MIKPGEILKLTAALIAAIVVIVLVFVAVTEYREARVREKVRRIKADQRTLTGRLGSYRIDH